MYSEKMKNYISHKGPCEGRIILHSDLNNFYASCESLQNQKLRDIPFAVCGNQEERHGIVLAKNNLAKMYGIKTGSAIWQAKKLCPKLICVKPNHSLYLEYSKCVNKIYEDYSSQVESFGIDEVWIDITKNKEISDISDSKKLANEIRERIKNEIGLTVSIGISDNKVFAKLASDYKKPDAITVFSPDNYEKLVMPQDISNLLSIGKKTNEKLYKYGIKNIGDLASSNEIFLKSILGKCGQLIYNFACGYDTSNVEELTYDREIKSIGNSITPYRNMENEDDVRIICYMLAEEVAFRLRSHSLSGKALAFQIRSNSLKIIERFCQLPNETNNSQIIAQTAMGLFKKNYDWKESIRSIGLRATNLSISFPQPQLSLYDDQIKYQKQLNLDKTIDNLKNKFGKNILQKAIVMSDLNLYKYS